MQLDLRVFGYNNGMKLIAKNRKAYFDYKILDDLEAGLVLLGPEIKSIRAGRANIEGSYVKPFVDEGGHQELWWVGSHFHLAATGTGDETRTKKLLVSRHEIDRWVGKLTSGNHTIVPLELYLQRGIAKLKIGLAERKQKHDKRQVLRDKSTKRTILQSLKKLPTA